MDSFLTILGPLVFIGGIILFFKYREATREKDSRISCPNCKYEGAGKLNTPGHILIEIILWLAFFVPGLIYSIWRLTKRRYICPQCSYEFVVKSNAKKRQIMPDASRLSGPTKQCPFCAETIKSEATVCRYCQKELK